MYLRLAMMSPGAGISAYVDSTIPVRMVRGPPSVVILEKRVDFTDCARAQIRSYDSSRHVIDSWCAPGSLPRDSHGGGEGVVFGSGGRHGRTIIGSMVR